MKRFIIYTFFFQLSLPLYVYISLHDDFNSQQIMLIA